MREMPERAGEAKGVRERAEEAKDDRAGEVKDARKSRDVRN